MIHPDMGPAYPEELFERFYELTAAEVMKPAELTLRLPEHNGILAAFEAFEGADHAWLYDGQPANVVNILLRLDLLHSVEPSHGSYTRIITRRFKSLAHGAADCTCRLVEGRRLKRIEPRTTCREMIKLMVAKNAMFLPVFDDGVFVGEVGAGNLTHRLGQMLADAEPQRMG